MRDDLIAAGDHAGWNDLTYAAAAEACGQDIDVPEIILYVDSLLSNEVPETEATGDHAAKMFEPGAVKSGYIYTMVINFS